MFALRPGVSVETAASGVGRRAWGGVQAGADVARASSARGTAFCSCPPDTCPEHQTERVVALVREAAAEAGRLIFGTAPVEFPVTTAVVTSYADAK